MLHPAGTLMGVALPDKAKENFLTLERLITKV
jgi:hypothetical protein